MKQAGHTKPSRTVSDGGAAGSERCRPERRDVQAVWGRSVGHQFYGYKAPFVSIALRVEFDKMLSATRRRKRQDSVESGYEVPLVELKTSS